jgi:hypothetical protein
MCKVQIYLLQVIKVIFLSMSFGLLLCIVIPIFFYPKLCILIKIVFLKIYLNILVMQSYT